MNYSKRKRVIDRKFIWKTIIFVYKISFEFAPNELHGHSSSHKISFTNFAVNVWQLGGWNYGNWFNAGWRTWRLEKVTLGIIESNESMWKQFSYLLPPIFLMLIFLSPFFLLILYYQQQMQLISVEISLL